MRTTDFTRMSPDGVALAARDWEPDAGPVQGGIYLLHGLGEHLGRYDALAQWLCAAGWRVRSHDHRGHGRSAGARGTLSATCDPRCEATPLVAEFASVCGTSPILMGFSMGGALAAEMVLSGCTPVRALVLSSPAFALPLTRFQKGLLAVLERVAPDRTIPSGLRPDHLSHDPAQVRAYVEDPLVHDRISARLLRWMLDAGTLARTRAAALSVPTLLVSAGADRIVDPDGARRFAARAPAEMLAAHEFEGAYHELFNEAPPWRAAALAALQAWLERLVVTAGTTGEGQG